jgi:putative hydrolase of the HAD superfamily
MTIQAVIFDRDNTLVYFDRAAMAKLERRVANIAPALPPGAAAAQWRSWPGPWPRHEADEIVFWQQFWEQLATRYELSTDIVAQLMQVGAFYHSCFAAFPDCVACLQSLHAHGLRLAVLTNFELPSIGPTLYHAGLDPAWFSVLISSATLGTRKPDPVVYLAAADALGVPPAACAVVDDLPKNIEGALAVGMRGILLDREHAHDQCTTLERIPSLHHLAELLL